jgi:hypothetical protein
MGMNRSKFARLVNSNVFRFAKTMPDNPHWYTLRSGWKSNNDFSWCVDLIRTKGHVEVFEDRPYMILKCSGMKFWTAGAAVDKTVLINCKRLPITSTFQD